MSEYGYPNPVQLQSRGVFGRSQTWYIENGEFLVLFPVDYIWPIVPVQQFDRRSYHHIICGMCTILFCLQACYPETTTIFALCSCILVSLVAAISLGLLVYCCENALLIYAYRLPSTGLQI